MNSLEAYASSYDIQEYLDIYADEQRANRLALADMLEHRVTDEQFDMSSWTNDCGTVGCALGIAALSGEFNGLGWNRDHLGGIVPVIAGHLQGWNSVGCALFGFEALDEVFKHAYPRSRARVARELRAIE